MSSRRRVPLSRLWGLSLLAASLALLGATWFLSSDPGVSAQVQALQDARTLADQLEEVHVDDRRVVAQLTIDL